MKIRSINFRTIFVVLSAAIIAAGCATFEGQMEMENMPPAVTWISPMNQDGINDSLNIQIDFPAYENLLVSEYNILVTDQMGQVVYAQGEKVNKSGTPKINVPDSFVWKGIDQNGSFVDDGEYKYYIEILYGRTEKYTSPTFTVIVDNTAPKADVSAAYPLFSPDGDGRLDTVRIFQRFSSVEDQWQGSILNSRDKVVKDFIWKGLARDFFWDGMDSDGKISEDGEYTYVLSCQDKAGNKAQIYLYGITINTEKAVVSISRSLEAFSPNNDGKKDTLALVPGVSDTANILSWEISVHDRSGEPVRTYSGTTFLPDSIAFDGKTNDGKLLPDGYYKGHLSVSYKNGTNPEEVSQLFEIDNTAPRLNLSADYLLFSPDGDGKLDALVINQSTSLEQQWFGSILNSSGNVVKTFEWKERAVQFSWDALDSTGKKVPDGLYRYRVECIDRADNYTVKELTGIRIDRRNPAIGISAITSGASPDGDGFNDSISFILTTDIPEDIKNWEIKIIDLKGSPIKTYASDNLNTALPSRIDWNGRDEQGQVIENEYTAQLVVSYLKGNTVTSRTKTPFLIDITGPKVSVSASPNPFSPDQDGSDDVLNIKTSAVDISGIDSWRIRIIDPAGNSFRTFAGKGKLEDVIRWNGLSEKNELVQSASDYIIEYTVKDKLGNLTTVTTETSVDILVIKDGDNLKIVISSIYFVPNKADFMSLDEDKIEKNLATLERLAEILKKYSQYKIRLEGHAVRVYWDNLRKLQTEQDEVLMPLSTERAEVIKEALIARGIESQRLTTIGYGGNRPVVPHSDLVNRWKNRRVEFILIKK